MSRKQMTLKETVKKEWEASFQGKPSKSQELYKRVYETAEDKLIYRDMPRPEQLLPPVLDEFMENGLMVEPSDARPSIEIPQHYYGFNSPATTFMIGLVLDANNARLRRLLGQPHTRALFKEDRYYEIVDDPSLYYRESHSSEEPAFHGKAILYLTSIGIMVYLKRSEALLAASTVLGSGVLPRTEGMRQARSDRQPKNKMAQAEFKAANDYEAKRSTDISPVFNVYAYQYASYVHCRDGDILRFQLDFLATKRQYYEGFTYLMHMNWKPNSPSMIMYRRRYYQYMTPFLDWIDTVRYLLKQTPSISVSSIYDRLINCHSENFTLRDMMPLGETMLECFEIRRLSKYNCRVKAYHGVYVGRKILRDKEPQTHADYKDAFNQGMAIRPVIPHVCSPMRRLLVHLYYYDKESMSTLAQILTVVDLMLRMDFFSMHPLCKLSAIHLEPLIFQIYDFVWLIKKNNTEKQVYLRQENWESIKQDEESNAWYLRWDVLNCVSLLFGVCQNALMKDLNEAVIDRIVMLIIEVLRSSEYLESVMSYSFFDTYFGLTSTVNCVPNLQSRCVLRVLKKLPQYLIDNFTVPALLSTFTYRFWKGLGDASQLSSKTIEDISEYLVLRNRRMSMKTAAEGGGEAISATSAMGAGGAVTLFYREYDHMPEITVEDEQAMDNDKNDFTRKEEEEKKHVREYKRMETDYRYSRLFTDSFFMGTGRLRIFYDENCQFKLCKQRTEELYKPQR